VAANMKTGSESMRRDISVGLRCSLSPGWGEVWMHVSETGLPASMRWRMTVTRSWSLARSSTHSSVSYGEIAHHHWTVRPAGGGSAVWAIPGHHENYFHVTPTEKWFGDPATDRDLGLFYTRHAVDAVHGGHIGLVGAQVINRTGAKGDDFQAGRSRARES